jgi:putative transposase
LRRRSPRPGDRWHLDELFLKINGQVHYLWRAVDLSPGRGRLRRKPLA